MIILFRKTNLKLGKKLILVTKFEKDPLRNAVFRAFRNFSGLKYVCYFTPEVTVFTNKSAILNIGAASTHKL